MFIEPYQVIATGSEIPRALHENTTEQTFTFLSRKTTKENALAFETRVEAPNAFKHAKDNTNRHNISTKKYKRDDIQTQQYKAQVNYSKSF